MKASFEKLVDSVKKAGIYAAENQHSISRGIKSDGTVLTETDTYLDKFLTKEIHTYYPDSIVISEESPSKADIKNCREWIFTIDPIDGTDSYSQGMPGWCVAVGVLSPELVPVGAIISMPRWGSEKYGGNLFSLEPGGALLLNGTEPGLEDRDFSSPGQLMIGTGLHNHFNYDSYSPKLRGSGSAVINITGAVMHSDIKGSLMPPCYIWDVAPAHAVIRKAGLDLEYFSNGPVDYSYLAERNKSPDHFVAGSPDIINMIRSSFIPRENTL